MNDTKKMMSKLPGIALALLGLININIVPAMPLPAPLSSVLDGRNIAATAGHEPFAQLPISFERNQGQLNSQVQFSAHSDNYHLLLTANEAIFKLADDNEDIVKMRLAGSN